MLGALVKAFDQLSDPRFQRVLSRALVWSIAVFFALVAVAWLLIARTTLFEIGWLEDVVDFFGGAAAIILGIILFPGISMAVLGFMLEEVADAVDARHYRDLPPARRQPMAETVFVSVRLFLATIVLNVVLLPAYFIPVLNLFVFFGLNGYLLGREYFELAAVRRMAAGEARVLRRRHPWRVIGAGAVIALLLSIPVAGWFMPVVGTAFMVHVVERLRRREAAVAAS